jgi:PIN domain nuclease of toxin-antitoxin system
VSRVILDASAVLALLFGETGADNVQKKLPGAGISAVNYSECLSKLLDNNVAIENGLLWLGKLNLTVHPFDVEVAALAASLRPATRGRDISFADRACLATAMAVRGLAVTAEREWSKLKLGVNVECIRPEAEERSSKKKG